MKTLKEILPPHLKRKKLTSAEEKLLKMAPKGEFADCQVGDEKEDDPANADKWGPERTVRAELLRWLLLEQKAVRRVHARGVWARGIRIEGEVELAFARVARPLLLAECAIPAGFNLQQASLVFFSLRGSHFSTFSADRLTVAGNLVLRGAQVGEEVLLLGAEIGGDLDCDNARFFHLESAFSGDRMTVRGAVFFREAKASGEVRFLGAEIGGILDCDRARFFNRGKAFSADRMTVKGSVFFREVKARGEVRLLGAKIGGVLTCEQSGFFHREDAFSADGMTVKGNLFFDEVKARGEVRLSAAKIDGDLDCDGMGFGRQGGTALVAENMVVEGTLRLCELKPPPRFLNLANAQVGQIKDDEKSWPDKRGLILNGFVYGGFAGFETPQKVAERLDWLRRQADRPFYPQPYEQLAKVYRETGHESDARTVLMAKQNALLEHGDLSFPTKALYWALRITTGHGYRPMMTLSFLALFWILGIGTFTEAERQGYMQKTRVGTVQATAKTGEADENRTPTPYPEFNPVVYSLDTLIPFVNLHQEIFWLPEARQPDGPGFRGYLWFHIAMGWVFSTLAALALSRWFRKE